MGEASLPLRDFPMQQSISLTSSAPHHSLHSASGTSVLGGGHCHFAGRAVCFDCNPACKASCISIMAFTHKCGSPRGQWPSCRVPPCSGHNCPSWAPSQPTQWSFWGGKRPVLEGKPPAAPFSLGSVHRPGWPGHCCALIEAYGMLESLPSLHLPVEYIK